MLVWLLAFLIFAFGIAAPTFAASYNSAGGLVINKAAIKAVDNSPVLTSCEEDKRCDEPEGPGKSQDAGPPGGGPGPH
ncbi:MAG: hypothetical protein HYW63_00740 [Candidatus Levybacteria bacterium]|nr:hypothetical protein [Candidatus Levybacteria bacterium]